MLLVSGSTRSVGRLAATWPNHLGHLLTPKNRNGMGATLATGLSWAVDNGAFRGFDSEPFRRLLRRVAGRPRLLWIACPDIVADCRATLDRFREWREEVAAAGPVAFVGQDGSEGQDLPWGEFDCLFVGGSTEWKLSGAAWDLAREAKRRGKWLHLGRVNSRRRLRYAWSMNADSTDGSSASMFGDKYIHKYLHWQAEMIPWRG
jgi:hypothetical protein